MLKGVKCFAEIMALPETSGVIVAVAENNTTESMAWNRGVYRSEPIDILSSSIGYTIYDERGIQDGGSHIWSKDYVYESL
jgi:hypothetical protein